MKGAARGRYKLERLPDGSRRGRPGHSVDERHNALNASMAAAEAHNDAANAAALQT
jgi:hypothetical protein